MQIPGLHLLNVPVPVPLQEETTAPQSITETSPKVPKVSNNEAGELVRATAFEEPKDKPVTADSSYANLSTREGVDQNTALDALDLALANPSEESPLDARNQVEEEEEEMGEEEDSSDSEKYRSSFMPAKSYSDSSDSDDDLNDITNPARIGFLKALDDDENDFDDGLPQESTFVRTKNEVIEELGPVSLEDTEITDSTAIESLGVVESVVDGVDIVRAQTDEE